MVNEVCAEYLSSLGFPYKPITTPLADVAPAITRLVGPTVLPNQTVRPSKPHNDRKVPSQLGSQTVRFGKLPTAEACYVSAFLPYTLQFSAAGEVVSRVKTGQSVTGKNLLVLSGNGLQGFLYL